MNEVTKIHLGRQAFTISVEAHKSLKGYLNAIKMQVADSDVINEVELRIVELLAEHGVGGDKVILPADVDFLKQQLGDPRDFKDDSGETPAPEAESSNAKRLFRDTDNGMVAGVAAGLAQYTGIDVLLIRILFIIGIFTGGWGILLYAVLWLLAPEAKTSSDRLQMAGKPVTVDSLRDIVERADIKGAAHRANNSLAGPLNSFFRIALKLIGVGFVITGLGVLFGLIAGASYLLVHSGSLLQDNFFPVGLKEHLLIDIALAVGAIIAIFIILFGMAMFRRKWPIHTWATATLIGLVFIGCAAGGALAADVGPGIRDRYNANFHTTVRPLEPFNNVSLTGEGVDVQYVTSTKYSVNLRYFGHPDLSTIKTTVKNGTLVINSQNFDWHRHCKTVCLPDNYAMEVTIDSPNPPPAPQFPAVPEKLQLRGPNMNQ